MHFNILLKYPLILTSEKERNNYFGENDIGSNKYVSFFYLFAKIESKDKFHL